MNRDDWEIHPTLPYAEGCQGEEPDRIAIIDALRKEGYHAYNIEVHWDGFQNLWRWVADINPVTS